MDQLDLIDTYRTFYPIATEHAFFSPAYETYSEIDHIVNNKTANSFFKTVILSSIFSNHNEIKLEINNKSWKQNKYMEINQLIPEQPIDEGRNLKISWNNWKYIKTIGYSKNNIKIEIYNNQCLYKKSEWSEINNKDSVKK